jgi:hypothetical protein
VVERWQLAGRSRRLPAGEHALSDCALDPIPDQGGGFCRRSPKRFAPGLADFFFSRNSLR